MKKRIFLIIIALILVLVPASTIIRTNTKDTNAETYYNKNLKETLSKLFYEYHYSKTKEVGSGYEIRYNTIIYLSNDFIEAAAEIVPEDKGQACINLFNPKISAVYNFDRETEVFTITNGSFVYEEGLTKEEYISRLKGALNIE